MWKIEKGVSELEIHVLDGSLLGGLLVYCTVWDLRKKEIPLYPVLVVGVFLLGIKAIEGEFAVVTTALGALLGIGLLGISKITKGGMGIGDAILFVVIGISVGFFPAINILFYSLLLAAVVSIILLVCRKVTRKQTIPFIPFILAGYMGVWLL